jgi:predicted amidophosphoribosyltransferase
MSTPGRSHSAEEGGAGAALAGAAAAWLGAAVALLAPPLCVACCGPLPRAAQPLCPACRGALPWLLGPRCARCGLPAPCGARCPMAGGAVQRAWAPLAYEGPARALVHALKFRGALGVADLMAAQIAANAPAGLLVAGSQLVAVPAPAARRRRRGFDHAQRLAAAIGARTGLPVARCLRRTGPAPRQARARRATRLAAGRVQVEVAGAVPPAIVLVDDVHTTGATLEACGRALRAAGAVSVVAVAYARAFG